MGSRYLYIVLIVFLEAHLSRGDYRRVDLAPEPRRRWRVGAPSARVVEERAMRERREARR
jgi:hypothetical protein